MRSVYVLDACAMLAVLAKEQGADRVVDAYKKAASGEIVLVMNKLNLLEVYYALFREYGRASANKFVDVVKQSPIAINHEISDEMFAHAGRLKATYKISLADSIALAQTIVSDGMLMTCDHHEFDAVEVNEKMKFVWIR